LERAVTAEADLRALSTRTTEFLDHLIPADELRLTRTTHTQKENEHG
jgi:hypothetical protein